MLVGAVVPQPFPPCSPPNAAPELVVDHFFARLGSSTDAIRECFTAGRPTDFELAMYAASVPPTSYRIESINVGRSGPNSSGEVVFIAMQVFASWRVEAPVLWARDDFRWIVLRRHEAPTRWTIEETQPPRRP